MADLDLSPRERVYFDVTSPLFDLTFSVIEAVLITGICWMGIGFLDRPGVAFNPAGRSMLLVGWLLLLVWRLFLPFLRARRRRFIITNHRILSHPASLGGKLDSIPLDSITGVQRRGSAIGLGVAGYPAVLWFHKIPKTRKAIQLLEQLL